MQNQIEGQQIRSSSKGAAYNRDAQIFPKNLGVISKFLAPEGRHEVSPKLKTQKYQSPPHNIKSPLRPDAWELCIPLGGFSSTKVNDMSPQGITARRPYDLNFFSMTGQP